MANLPLVSLIPVVHLDLQISPRIFEKIRNDPNVIFRGLEEDGSRKNLKQPISWHSPFNVQKNEKKFLPAQESETFSSGCLETVGVGGHLQALLQAVQGLTDRHQRLSSGEQCWGSGSGIRCFFFNPWIRIRGPESGMSFSGSRISDPGSQIRAP